MDKSLAPSSAMPSFRRVGKILLPIAVVYLVLLFGQPAGFEPGRLIREIISDPTILVQQLISGLANAAIVTIIAIGYTMVYGIVEMVNFAHSSVFMLGTMVALLFMVGLSGGVRTPLWLAILAFIPAMLFCGGLNATIERFAYRSLRKQPKIVSMIAALGMDFILQNVGLQLGAFGKLPNAFPNDKSIQWLTVLGNQAASPKAFPQVLDSVNILEPIFGKDVPLRIVPAEVMVIVTALILVFALTWFIGNTRAGKAMRAVAQNPAAAAMMGIDVDRIINLTYAIGGALAGGAAVMYGLYKGNTSWDVGFVNGLYSFTAAVVGGIGNIKGAALGALMIGVISSLSNQLLTSSDWSKALVFVILVLVLVFKPTGILGSEGGEKA